MPSYLTTALLATLCAVGVALIIAGIFKNSSALAINGGMMVAVFAVVLRGTASQD